MWCVCCFFFFKQKTAYEMRISDWSSDVCSSDLSSLIGQGCVQPGLAKITFGTGGMLDINLGDRRPGFAHQGDGGCFPIVAWQAGGRIVWGAEAVMLAAGTNVEWLRDDLGIIASATESHDVASLCETSEGVVYVRSEEHTSELQS